MVVFKIPVEHNGGNVAPAVHCSFKREGEIVVFKIPVEHNGGNVVPALETVMETVPLSREEKWSCLKFLWSIMEVMLLLPGNSTVDCSFKQGGEMVVFKIPVEHNGGNVAPAWKQYCRLFL